IVRAKIKSIDRQATMSDVVRPARTSRTGVAGRGRSKRIVQVRANAAGPCCQRAWLATAQRFDASIAARTVGKVTRRRPRARKTPSKATPNKAARQAEAPLDIALAPTYAAPRF